MTIVITIVAILLITVGVVYGMALEFVRQMTDVPYPMAKWEFMDYLMRIIIPLSLIALGVGLLIF